MTLLEECIEALGNDKRILNENDNITAFKNFENNFPITSYGRIDWDKLEGFEKINIPTDILKYLSPDDKCLIIWNEMSLPIIETTIMSFLNNIDDILAVSYDTWIIVDKREITIEFYHNRLITLLKNG